MRLYRFLLLFMALAVGGFSATALSPSDAIRADGEYSYPPLRAGITVTYSLTGTFGSGTATVGYLDASGNFVSLGKTFTAAGAVVKTLPETSAGKCTPAVSLTGATSPVISTTITKVESGTGALTAEVDLSNLAQSGASTGQVPVWNGTAWEPDSVAAGGENWIFEGDSWTAGTAQSNDRETWPYYLQRLQEVQGRVTCVNVALAGQTAATMVGTFSSQIAPYLTATTGKPSTVFIFAGINDGVSRTTTQVRTDLRSLWTSARTGGARVVAFTLPHRSAAGWSQADWATVNANIIADASYYDVLIRMDIAASNASAADYTDTVHISTAAHARLASRIFDVINGRTMMPLSMPHVANNAVTAHTFSANTKRGLTFTSELFDDNGDCTGSTIGSDSNVSTFTVPVDGTYMVSGNVLMGGLASGDNAFLSAYLVPIATGLSQECRLQYNVSAGANMGLGGQCALRLKRGDTLHLGITSSKANSNLINNPYFSTFNVRLLSIP